MPRKAIKTIEVLLLLIIPAVWAGSLSAGEHSVFVANTLGSRHLGADLDYEEFNPGVGLGMVREETALGTRLSAELGGYRNSHAEVSGYIMGLADWAAGRLSRRVTLRAGLVTGLAYYPHRGDGFRRKGVPAVGDWVPVVGATASLSGESGPELRVAAFPAMEIADLVVTFQLLYPLTGRR